ncbi:MAG: VapC toxin family PIN domain ribonuclease [Anaerolineae bacterium]|nr:MAG: VapC toxin family PIN domain ribonuclease [Anaerolineae bacterium]WKZ49159.1 MAG: type II toxin-antitoxin system VapC family toxin [Anaerolineales bacterium]
MIVVDANMIGYFFITGDYSPLAIQVFEKDPDWYAPMLWQSEVRSIITQYVRYKKMPLAQSQQLMNEVHDLMLEHERFVSSNLVLELVAISKCSSYDCEYIALAKEMNLNLVTFDKEILQEFPQIAISPKDFIAI